MYEELNLIAEASDNPLEFFFAAIIYAIVHLMFRVVEVIVEYENP